MVTQSQREKFQTLMRGTILSLCQNVLEHKSEIKIEVFIGITLDKKQDFHFSVVETLRADAVSGSTEVTKAAEPPTQPAPQPPPASATEGPTHQSAPDNQGRSGSRQAYPTSTPRGGAGSMLERLMTQDVGTPHRALDNYRGLREVSPSPRQKGREVSSSTTSEAQQNPASLSYSELLRSFGEMSRQDNTPGAVPPPSQATALSCPTLYNSLTSGQSGRRADSQGSVNQAQVVIPINFAIHSPSGGLASGSGGSQSYEQNSRWQESPSRSKAGRYKEKTVKMSPQDRHINPDSTYGSDTVTSDANAYSASMVKVKQEVLSEEELEPHLDTSDYGMRHPMVPPKPQSLSQEARHRNSTKDVSPSPSTDSSTASSSRGILMSLLCERPPEQGKKRGRPKKRPASQVDPAYSQSLSVANLPPRDPSTLRDSRVLIGLTDYLPGFKDGDFTEKKPPRLMFAGQDICAKARKVVLLNSGAFSTVRMVHRSLQGMKASEIGQIMRDMTKPRDHPDYVGEYKMVYMPQVRQGRKTVGVFYKCPPEMVSAEALEKFDIMISDYQKFYEHVFRYDRIPQPQYFEAIEIASPFTGIFGGERCWRSDIEYNPDNTLSPTDPLEEELLEESHDAGDGEGPSLGTKGNRGNSPNKVKGMGLRIVKVKTEQEWESGENYRQENSHYAPENSQYPPGDGQYAQDNIHYNHDNHESSLPQAYSEYTEMEVGTDDVQSGPPVTSSQRSRSWSDGQSPGQEEDFARGDELSTPYLDTDYAADNKGGSEMVGFTEHRATTVAEEEEEEEVYDSATYKSDQSSVMCSQPVFPQPFIVQEKREQGGANDF